MVLVRRPQPHARAVIQPQTPAFRLFHWHFKPLPAPDAIHPARTHPPSTRSQKRGHMPVAIPAEPFGKLDDSLSKVGFVCHGCRYPALGGAVLADHRAGPAL